MKKIFFLWIIICVLIFSSIYYVLKITHKDDNQQYEAIITMDDMKVLFDKYEGEQLGNKVNNMLNEISIFSREMSKGKPIPTIYFEQDDEIKYNDDIDEYCEELDNIKSKIIEDNNYIVSISHDVNGFTSKITITAKNLNNNSKISSEPYIPDGVKVANPNDNSGIKASDLKFNRSPENVTIEVLEDTITRESAEILITDNNEQSYGWGEDFRLQKKENNNWKEMETTNELGLAFIDIAYNLDENHQLKLNVQYGNYYGSLGNGIYRIVKSVYDNGYIDLYSSEFEIK